MKTRIIQEDVEFSLDPAALVVGAGAARGRVPPPSVPERKAPGLSLLLRTLGGLVIVAAFVMYLFQGWREGDDLTRSLLLLGHTAVLTLAGLASGHLLREAKGARLFILTLSIQLGLRIMARRSAWPLTGLYLLANAALLIPTRADLVIAVTLLGLGAVLAARAIRLRRLDPSLATPEGLLARALLALPLLVLGGRSIWLYAPDTLFFTVLGLSGYLALRLAATASAPDSLWRGALEGGALLFAVLVTYLALDGLIETRSVPDVAKAPLAAGVLALLLIDLSTLRSRWSRAYRGAAALVMALATLLDLAAFGGFVNALVSLCVGTLILVYGYDAKARFVFGTGLLTALTGLGVAAHAALSSFTVGGWSALVALGIAIIVAGSIVERYGDGMRTALTRWNRHFERAP